MEQVSVDLLHMGLIQVTVRGYEETWEVKTRIELRGHEENVARDIFIWEKLDGKEVQGLFEDSRSEELE